MFFREFFIDRGMNNEIYVILHLLKGEDYE